MESKLPLKVADDLRGKDIPLTLYEKALLKIKVFLGADHSNILTIGDLAKSLIGIPESLDTIARELPKILQKRSIRHLSIEKGIDIFSNPEKRISKRKNGSEIWFAWTKEGYISMGKEKQEGSRKKIEYRVVLPKSIDPDLAPEISLVEAYAIGGEDKRYDPSDSSSVSDRDTQQEYINLLKVGIEDVLSILPKK